MLSLYYSNYLESLVDLAATQISGGASENAKPFARSTVLVSHPYVGDFLKRRIAEKFGFYSGHGFSTLVDFATTNRDPERSFGSQKICEHLLHLFEELADQPDFAPIDDYLSGGGELRAFQLAWKLSRLFSDYENSSPELFSEWSSKSKADLTKTVRWQKVLREHLLAAGHEGSPLSVISCMEKARIPAKMWILGYSFFSPAELKAIEFLSNYSDVHLFTVNPSQEFWDDQPYQKKESDCLPLSLWASPALFSFKSLNQIANWDFTGEFVKPTGESKLLAVQSCMLERTRVPAVETADDSLRVVACDGPLRESEAVVQDIRERFENDNALRLDDIAIVLPSEGIETYRASLSALLNQDGGIPHYFLDIPLHEQSQTAAATNLLFNLPLGSNTRPEILAVLTHPAVRGAASNELEEEWIRFADELGIIRGASQEAFNGTYVQKDLFNWKQGFQRLALGAFMVGERTGNGELFDIDGKFIAPWEMPEDEIDSASHFLALSKSLLADCSWLLEQKLTMKAWARLLVEFLDTYIVPTSDWEEGIFAKIKSSVLALETQSTERRFPYLVAKEFACRSTDALTTTQGDPASGGVPIGPLTTLQKLPRKFIYALGMGEGAFASSDGTSSLDVRSAIEPRADTSARLRDRYRFCELILSSRHGLIFTYSQKNPKTGEIAFPGAPVQELMQLSNIREPDAFVPKKNPGDVARKQLVELARNSAGSLPSETELRDWVFKLENNKLRSLLTMPADVSSTEQNEWDKSLSLRMIRDFLVSPAQGWAKHIVGISEIADDSPRGVCDEAFDLSLLLEVSLLRSVAQNQAGRPRDSWIELHQNRLQYLEMTGKYSTGVFVEGLTMRHEDILSFWQAELAAKTTGDICAVGIGEINKRVSNHDRHPAIVLPDETKITGSIHCISDDSLVYFYTSDFKKHHLLQGYVDALALGAMGLLQGRNKILAIGKSASKSHALPAFSKAQALQQLYEISRALKQASHAYLLPFEAVCEYLKKSGSSLVEKIKAEQESERSASSYGPLRAWSSLSIPTEEQARAMVMQRFRLFFPALFETENSKLQNCESQNSTSKEARMDNNV